MTGKSALADEDQLFQEKDIPEARKPGPPAPLMRPDEVLTLKRAMHLTGLSERTLRDWANDFGVGRQSVANGRLEFSVPALMMMKQGRLDLLERFRAGDRESPDILEYFDVFGVPGPEILPTWVDDTPENANIDCRKPRGASERKTRDDRTTSKQERTVSVGFDSRGNDRSVALMLNGGNVLKSYRTQLVMAASKAGMTVNEFTLRAVGRHLQQSGADLRGVFVPGDIEEDI